MAGISIEKRPRASGQARYRALVRIKRDGVIVHRESKTFDKKAQARAWAQQRAEALEGVSVVSKISVGDLIAQYIEAHQRTTPIGRSKLSCLRFLATWPISRHQAQQLAPHHIVEHCQARIHSGASPSTVGQDVAFLRSVFSASEGLLGLPLSLAAFERSSATLRRLGLVGRAHKRDRRPTREELDSLMAFFSDREASPRWRNRQLVPMTTILPLAIATTRRCGELVNRIRREEIKEDRMLVRDMKHPGEKVGNHQWCYLPPVARPLMRQALDAYPGPLLLPFKPDSVSNAFTQACKALNIEGLHFHDLRHEGISWLFEQGWPIPRVAAVSGHRSWDMLKRYTQIGIEEPFDRWENWPWFTRARQD